MTGLLRRHVNLHAQNLSQQLNVRGGMPRIDHFLPGNVVADEVHQLSGDARKHFLKRSQHQDVDEQVIDQVHPVDAGTVAEVGSVHRSNGRGSIVCTPLYLRLVPLVSPPGLWQVFWNSPSVFPSGVRTAPTGVRFDACLFGGTKWKALRSTNVSLRKGSNSRGDKTPLELFLAGVRGWEAGLRCQIESDKPKLE